MAPAPQRPLLSTGGRLHFLPVSLKHVPMDVDTVATVHIRDDPCVAVTPRC